MRYIVSFCLLFVLLANSACSTTYHKRRSFSPAYKQAHYQNFSVIRTEMAIRGLELGSPMMIRAFKSEMLMEIWVLNKYSGRYDLFKTYPICQKSGTLGPKLAEGDLQTPEGFYYTTAERLNPNSKYYLSFDMGYPNEFDRAWGRTGAYLMIHGGCVSEGCLAMNDKNIGEIYVMLDETFKRGVATAPIHIFPFRMTEENMTLRAGSDWMPFWRNLKEGYDYFELNHVPAYASVSNKKYIFADQASM
jgi:murein L,D-transpeptidase YafK